MSKWKAGQCVTINGKKYRIVKSGNRTFVNCIRCSLFMEGLCFSLCEEKTHKLPNDCYLKEIKPKS